MKRLVFSNVICLGVSFINNMLYEIIWQMQKVENLKKEIKFGDVIVKPGEIGFGTLTTVELADSTVVKLPIIVMNGAEDGPKLLISSAVHGGELVGVDVVRVMMREKLSPKKLKGAVIGIPIGNPLSFMFGERASPQDHMFGPKFDRPGDPKGSITERLGAVVWDQVTSKMDLRIDIHGNYPPCTAFCLLSMHDPRIRDKSAKMAEATGLTIVYSSPKGTLVGMEAEYDESYQPPPSVTLELIDARRVTNVSTDLGVRAILNVMKQWAMIEGEIEKQPKEYVWGNGRVENGGTLTANKGGIIHFTKIPGEFVRKGEIVAKIYNPYGDIAEEIEFPFDGYIRAYTYTSHQAVNTGDTIAYITHDK